MSLISLGNMMASEIRVDGGAIKNSVPNVLFQSGYQNSVHAGGHYHPYATSGDGQKFLIPRPETVSPGGRGGRGGTVDPNEALAAAVADRHASSAPTSTSTAPITVVLHWPSILKRK